MAHNMFEVSVIYDYNIASKKKVRVNQGGTSSGKTWSILQILFTKAVEKKRVITVIGQDIPNIKKGAFRMANEIIDGSEILRLHIDRINKGERVIYFVNGSIIEFVSFKDAQDAKSGKRDIAFLNEADGIDYQIYWQVKIRTNEIVFIDYNPTQKFWIHTKVLGKPDAELFISDHRNNPFLSVEKHEEIEAIDDFDYFKVYARGLTGVLRGLIYSKWQKVEDWPPTYKYRWFGLDFGFSNSYTSLVEVRFYEGQLYLKLHIYELELTSTDISDRIKKGNFMNSDDVIVADSAAPSSIEELNRLGHKVIPVSKVGIIEGINIVKKYYMNVVDSPQLVTEFMRYKWKVDKHTGEALNEPVKMFDHAMDAIRYVVGTFLVGDITQRRKRKVRTTKMAS